MKTAHEIELPEPTRENDLDEIVGLIWALLREGESALGIKTIVSRAWRSGRVRRAAPVLGMRLSTIDDYRHDLEECVVHLKAFGATRRALNPVLKTALPASPKKLLTPAQRAVLEAGAFQGVSPSRPGAPERAPELPQAPERVQVA